MLNLILLINQAVDQFLSKDINELDQLRISDAEWELLGEIAGILAVSYYIVTTRQRLRLG